MIGKEKFVFFLFYGRQPQMKAKRIPLLQGKKALWVLYAGLVLLRFLMALCTSLYPTVAIDEYLYYNMARSIAGDFTLMFRGQPANYAFFLYPLVISPVYLLFGEGANIFRIIQLWNLLIMNTAIFPVYGLCKACLKDEKKALGLSALFLLMPDFILGQLIFSEVLIYPLFYTILYCAYRCLTRKEGKQLVFIGVMGALLYFIKPGSVVPALFFLGLFLVQGLVKKEKKMALSSLLGMGAFAAVFGLLVALLRFGFHSNAGLLSLYDNQVNAVRGIHLEAFFRALVLYPYYFILCCGVVGFLYPVRMWKHWEKENRQFALSLLVCLAAMIIGTAWSINHHEYYMDTMHLRYIAMYIPLSLLFCALPAAAPANGKQPAAPKKGNLLLLILLGYTALCTLIFGCDGGADYKDCYPYMALSVLLAGGKLSVGLRWAVNILILALCGFTWYWLQKEKRQKNMLRICTLVMALVICASSIYSYNAYANKASKKGSEYASATEESINGEEYLYIFTDEKVMNHVLDVNSKANANYIQLYDLCNHLVDTNGCYTPFVPETARGQMDVKEMPEVSMLVMDETAYDLVELSDTAHAENHDILHIIRFEKDKPLFKSVISNLAHYVLPANQTGILILFHQPYLQQPLTIRFQIDSPVEQTFQMFSTSEMHEVSLKPGKDWYQLTFQNPKDAYNFKVDQEKVEITAYQMNPQ